MMEKRNYGWKKDVPDNRDFKFKALPQVFKELPSKIDLRQSCPPIINQLSLGSCTACAIGNLHYYNQLKQKKADSFMPSRLFIYYNERALEGTIPEDAGATIRDGMKVINKFGTCKEITWPYNIRKFAKKPTPVCYSEAMNYQAIIYEAVAQNLPSLKACLASGYPIVFGIMIYESFESEAVERTGDVPLPISGEPTLGGHAILAVGYDDSTQRFIIMNSWGNEWGDNGYFYLPYQYVLDRNLSADFWTLKLVE